FRAVAMDRRSQGRSQQVSDGLYPGACADDIKSVIDQFHLNPVSLIAWSVGVRDTLAYFAKYGTGAISHIVLIDGFAGGDLESPKLANRVQFVESFQLDRRSATKQFVRSMFVKPQDKKFLDALDPS